METLITTNEQIDALNLQNRYTVETLKGQLEFAKIISQFHPCELWVDTTENLGTLYLSKDENIIIRRNNWGKGAWQIYQREHFDNLDNYRINELKKTIQAPHNFKVLSSKNILAHIKYEKEVNALCRLENEKAGNKTGDFLEKVKQVANETGATLKIKMPREGIAENVSGRLIGKNFEYSFTLQKNGYVSQELRKISYENNLDEFVRLEKLQ